MWMFLSLWTVVDIFQVNLFYKISHEVDNAFFFTLHFLSIQLSIPFTSGLMFSSMHAYLLSFNLLHSTIRVKLSSFPLYRWASWGLERVNDLAGKRKPISGRGRIWTPLCVTPSEGLVIRYEGTAGTLRGILTTLLKALGSGVKNNSLSQLLLHLIETSRESFLPKVGHLYEIKFVVFTSLSIVEQWLLAESLEVVWLLFAIS